MIRLTEISIKLSIAVLVTLCMPKLVLGLQDPAAQHGTVQPVHPNRPSGNEGSYGNGDSVDSMDPLSNREFQNLVVGLLTDIKNNLAPKTSAFPPSHGSGTSGGAIFGLPVPGSLSQTQASTSSTGMETIVTAPVYTSEVTSFGLPTLPMETVVSETVFTTAASPIMPTDPINRDGGGSDPSFITPPVIGFGGELPIGSPGSPIAPIPSQPIIQPPIGFTPIMQPPSRQPKLFESEGQSGFRTPSFSYNGQAAPASIRYVRRSGPFRTERVRVFFGQ